MLLLNDVSPDDDTFVIVWARSIQSHTAVLLSVAQGEKIARQR